MNEMVPKTIYKMQRTTQTISRDFLHDRREVFQFKATQWTFVRQDLSIETTRGHRQVSFIKL